MLNPVQQKVLKGKDVAIKGHKKEAFPSSPKLPVNRNP